MVRASIAPPLALLALLLCTAVAQAQPCECIDIGDIKRRIKEAQAAINAYTAELQRMAEQMMRTQQPIAFTEARRQMLQNNVQGALNTALAGTGGIATVPSLKGHNPGGTTNVCTIEINLHPSASACMRESIKRHEELHQKECLRTMGPGRVIDAVGRGKAERWTMLTEYAVEEVNGYATEIAFLQSELTRLENSPACKPKPRVPELRDYTAQPRSR